MTASDATHGGAPERGALEPTAQVLRHCVDDAPAAFAMLDTGMRYLAASERWKQDYGVTGIDLTGRHHYDVFPEVPEHWKAIHARCLAGAVEHKDEELFVRADGHRQWVRWEVRPWRTDAGQIGGLIIFSEDVTARKEAERALQERSQQLLAALNSMTDAVFISDTEGRLVEFNEAFATFHRFARKEDCATTLAQYPQLFEVRLVDGTLVSLEEWAIPRALRGETAVNAEYHLRRTDSGETWIGSYNFAPIKDLAGAIIGAVAIGRDVTAEKQAAAALESVRARQQEDAEVTRLLFEGAAEGILVVDHQGTIVSANAALESMFGWDVGELVGQPLHRLLPSTLRATHDQHVAGYSAAPRRRSMGVGLALSAQRKNGTTFPVEVSLNHVATPGGGRTMAFVTDITARKRVEDELRESEGRLRFALDAAEAGAWMWDVEQDRVYADERMARRFGVSANEPFSSDQFLSLVYEADRDLVRQGVEAVLRPDGPDGWSLEYRMLRPDGRVVWYQSIGQAERVAGRTVRVTGLTLNVNARKESEAEVQRSHAVLRGDAIELNRQAQQLRRLASDLTLAEHRTRERLAKTLHDGLQQLLFSAMLKIDRAAKRSGRLDELEAAREALQEAIASARSLSVELAPPVLEHGSLREALEWLAASKKRKYGLSVVVRADPAAADVDDEVRLLLFESVRELLFNVVKHAGTDHASVDLTQDSQGRLRIVVSDAGVGFDSTRPFDPAASHSGGLGLFSIRERLTLLGGELRVESSPARGSCFTLIVPSALSRGPSADAAAGATSSGGEADRPLRVLIADDHAVVREGLRELLAEQPGFEVVGEAVDGLDAVERALALRPDIIVMDVAMPRMDGVEATRRIRAALPAVQIYGLSTHEQMDGLHAIEEAGAAGYFTKGEGVHRLMERLRTDRASDWGREGSAR